MMATLCCEGELLKREALTLLEARREVYVLRGRRALLGALLCSGTATADDVRDAVELPPGINPKLFGSVPGSLAKAGIIRASRLCQNVPYRGPCSPCGRLATR